MVDSGAVGAAPAEWRTTDGLPALVFPIRHISIALVGLAVLVVPSLGNDRWQLSALMLLVVLPIDLVFARWSREHGRFPVAMPFVEQVFAIIVVAVNPRALVPAIVLIVADITLAAVSFGRQVAGGAALVGLVGFSALALAGKLDDPLPALLSLAIANGSVVFIVSAVSATDRILRGRYSTLVEGVDVTVYEVVPGSNRFSYVSPGAGAMLGYPLDAWLVPGFWPDHIHPDDADRTIAEGDAAIAAGIDHVLEYRMVASDGRAIFVRDVATVETDAGGRAVNMRGVMMDVSDRRRAEELLRIQATHDSLTGLPNRALLADRLDVALRESRRTGDRTALLLLDLDQFKEVNDALGHLAGDRLLIAFADRLREELRDCDTIARLGGDEFAVLLTTDAAHDGAVIVAKRILASVEAPFDIEGMSLHAGTSIGIALFPDHAADAATLTTKADVAMYLAKRSGSGYATYEPDLDRSSVLRLTLLGQLRRAIESDQLCLRHQPCFDLETGQVVASEALVRWEHPELGLVAPTDFIRLAEVSGLIEPLTRWVVRRAIEEHVEVGTAEWLEVSVNLSVRNLSEPDLVPWISALLTEHAFPPERLIVELTESEVVGDVGRASAVLGELRSLGVKVSIDDFGTGQSALAHLKFLPLDELKVDRSFVSGLGHDEADRAIVGTIIELAHRLGLRVVAEGVSDPECLRVLRTLGCDRGQGFHLATPLSASELASLSRSSRSAGVPHEA